MCISPRAAPRRCEHWPNACAPLIKSTSLRILSICANRTIFVGWRTKPPVSIFSSIMPATFPEARLEDQRGDIRHAWELKVFGYINLTRLIHADMKARNNGVIVNIIGAAGERFNYDYITGSTGNAALMAFTKSLGGKSLHYGVRAVGINPGPVATDRHVYLMKTRARNELGDENRYSELLKDFATRARRQPPRNSRHGCLSGI